MELHGFFAGLDPHPRYTDGDRRSASYRDEQGLLVPGIRVE
jgi:hypothetical protein